VKNLGKTIDRIIKVDPALEEKLIPIKNKWKRSPSKTMAYWKELLDYLNSNPLLSHPHRSEIRNIVNTKTHAKRKYLYTFEPTNTTDKVIVVIPENLADIIRRNDRQTLEASKQNMEASLTRNAELAAIVARKETILELNSKKIWLALRDHFQLWSNPQNVSIKAHGNMLVVVEQSPVSPSFVGPGLVKMDPHTLRQFIQFLGGMDPSQGYNPEDEKKP
jgi:hypothetical protein